MSNNSLGVASLGWNIKLLTYQPNHEDNYNSVTAQKIKDAADAGAQVINLSFKTLEYVTSCNTLAQSNINLNPALVTQYYINFDYSLVRDAITYAVGKNCVVVAAAGNTNDMVQDHLPCENVPYPCYPAQYSNVIAVSGSQQDNTFVDGWNYGSFIAVNAPGQTNNNVGLWTTDLQNSYTNDGNKTRGTSFSTPQVSALAALIKSIDVSLSPAQITTILENSTDKIDQTRHPDNANGWNQYTGYGRINAYKALKYTIEHYGGTFNQNVTIPAGDAWNLQPGITLTFASGASLVVSGTLNAIGNSTSGINFNRSGTTGTWGGIQFNSGSSGNLQYCLIQNANNGIYLYNSSPQLNNNTISNCNMGIYCDYYSSPTMHHNLIQSNNYGIWCNGGSSPNLATASTSGNVIRYNTYNSVYAIYGSNPTLGVSSFGGNSFYSNGKPSVSAIYSSNVNAINNWWGMYPPLDSLFYTYYGTITYMPALTSNPNYSIVNNNSPTTGTSLNTSLSVMGDDLGTALDKQKDKKYDEAIPLFLQVFKNNPDALTGKYALSKIEECFTQAGKKDYLDYSKREIKPLLKEGTETYAMAIELETHQIVNTGMYKDAVDNLLTILRKYNLNSYIEKNTLFRLGAFYHLFYGDEVSSDNYFEELKRKYLNDELVSQIEIIKRFGVVSNNLAQNSALMPAQEINTSAENNNNLTISNYPNPFNPTTKISFSLPQKSQVKLKVFDVLGREIQILADGIYEAGKHEVEFNATNMPSGVYFYNLSTGSTSITKKMLLLR